MRTYASTGASRSRRLRLLAVAACVLAMGCSGQAPATAPSAPVSSAALAPAGTLDGRVMLPEEAVGPSHVIPTGIGRVIPTGQGRVIPTGQGRYRVAAVADELPVTGAEVAVFDAGTHQPLGTTHTDDAGRFHLAGLATGRNVLVEVTAPVGDTTFHLLALGRPDTQATPPAVAVSWRSTAVVAELLKNASVDLGSYALTAEADAEAALAQKVDAETPAERTATIVGTISQTISILPSPGVSPVASSAPLPLPSLGLTSPQPSPSGLLGTLTQPVTTTVASTVPTVTQAVADTTQATANQVQSVATPVVTTVESTAPALTQTVTQAAGSLLATPTPTSTPTSTATPTPTPTPSSLLGGLTGGLGL